ncbi:MAG: HPr family phosphocarrier protein [Lachnospiraceae bacterium]|nr:HPr family phosphocarrier protein [Lachnospiraceae bacterium]
MVSKTVTVTNPSGLHLRPAGLLCDAAVQFQSHIVFKYKNSGEANAKSVLSVLGACVRNGDEIEICCDGEDEEKALETLADLVESGFGEK